MASISNFNISLTSNGINFSTSDPNFENASFAMTITQGDGSKSYFGEAALQGEDKARYGTPPPVLIFEYLGHHGFNKVPVILSGYSIELNDSVDYIPVTSVVKAKGSDKLEEQTTFVPTRANIMVELAPAYTPKKVREKFDVEAFRNGSLYRDGFI